MFDNKYPYTDNHELNLDWILDKVTGIDDRFTSIEEVIDTLRRNTIENIQRIDGEIRSINDTIGLIESDIVALIGQWRQVAPDFDESVVYYPGRYVFYEKVLYKRKPGSPETAGTWNPSYWEHVTVADRLVDIEWLTNTLNDQFNILDGMVDDIESDLAQEYNEVTTYNPGSFCLYQGKLYRCINTTSGAFDSTAWIQTNLGYEIYELWLQNIRQNADIANNFSALNTYSEGDFVLYNDILYKALSAVPAGMTPSDHPEYWDNTSLSEELKAITPVQNVLTLEAGDSGVNWLTDKVTASSVVEVFASEFGIVPTGITVTPGVGVDVSFDILDHDVDILIRLS